MPHGDHDEAEIEAALMGEMPPPYCERNWRQSVGIIGVTAAIVLGLSVEQFMVRDARGGWVGTAVADARTLPEAAATAATPVAMQQAAVMPVAMMQPGLGAAPAQAAAPGWGAQQQPAAPGWGAQQPATAGWGEAQPAADPNVRFVQRTERTAFNFAATTVRPAVVGVRASLAAVPGRPQIERVGSGVIVDPSGFIVTCHHVVAGAARITINRYRDAGPPLSARLIAVDNDLALLQVDGAQGLPTATLADSSAARVGDWVIAVGHPFGLGLTVTAGIIGQRHGVLRIPGGREYSGLIQTDAPTNEGSSGGPLVDMQGRVVGLNTAIYAPTGVFSGAGFAIPSNVIAAFLARHVPRFAGPTAQLSRQEGRRDV